MLLVYTTPPDLIVLAWLEVHLPPLLAARGISARIMLGHPLFTEEPNQSGIDAQWPALGVEHPRDITEYTIGSGFNEFSPAADFHGILNALREIPQYRRSAPDSVLDQLSRARRVQKWHHHVKSEVIIAGFASGGTGRATQRIMYEIVEGVIPAMQHDIQEQVHGVKVLPQSDHQTHLTSDQFATQMWGFEIPLLISQVRQTFREKPTHPFTDKIKFDIHFSGSRTQFGPTKGMFDFGAGGSSGRDD